MVCPRNGAHSSSGFSLCEGMVIDQRFRTKIYVNIKTNQATIEAGVLLSPLSVELGKLVLALPSGSCPNNGFCGLTLGGGIGFLTRKFGVTSDSLLELRTVLANDEMVTANNVENEDLYWASKGGGGCNFGIVTSFTFQVQPINEVVIFQLTYSFDVVKKVLDAWQHWAPFTVDELTAELDIFSPTSIDFMLGLLKQEFNFGVPQPRSKIPRCTKIINNTEDDNTSIRHLIITGLFLGSREELVKLIEPVSAILLLKFKRLHM